MKRTAALLFLALLAFTVSGCKSMGTFGATMFTGAHLGDLKLEGIKSGPCVPATTLLPGTGNLPAGVVQALADAVGGQALGSLMPVTQVGATRPIWIFCAGGAQALACERIPINAPVVVYGQPLGPVGLILPSRVSG